MTTAPRPEDLQTLISLSRTLGRPENELVILAEGNTSLRVAPERMLVKATGSSLASASADDFVQIELGQFLELIDDDTAGDDHEVARVFEAARSWGTKRASVEALLHAVCQQIEGVSVVGHTHPVAVNAILCSGNADALVRGSLFPDQIVVLGTNPLLVEYTDPGIALARTVKCRIAEHIESTGRPPRVIYLANHGMFALGASADEVMQITIMAVKVAKVLLGAFAAGGPVYLDPQSARRIDTRPDEEYRRAVLMAGQP